MAHTRCGIIATLGPTSSHESELRKMIDGGLDMVRLNFSHGTRRDQVGRIRLVKRLNTKRRRAIRILQDLEGPRIRIGNLPGGSVLLRRRDQVWLVRDGFTPSKGIALPLDYRGSLAPVSHTDMIFLDDGSIALEIQAVQRNRIRTAVVVGGVIKSRKGVNIPGTHLEFPVLSSQDEEDIRLGLEEGVDLIAQSFVRNREEMAAVAEMVRDAAKVPKLVAKIEDSDGIENVDSILEVADGIMIARGDLGVSLPIWEVPIFQKKLIARARTLHKFTITATQMLESMTEMRLPTRAEVADVANAVLDGSDYLMLSAETAVGKHPAAVVDMMNRICAFTEANARLDLPHIIRKR